MIVGRGTRTHSIDHHAHQVEPHLFYINIHIGHIGSLSSNIVCGKGRPFSSLYLSSDEDVLVV